MSSTDENTKQIAEIDTDKPEETGRSTAPAVLSTATPPAQPTTVAAADPAPTAVVAAVRRSLWL